MMRPIHRERALPEQLPSSCFPPYYVCVMRGLLCPVETEVIVASSVLPSALLSDCTNVIWHSRCQTRTEKPFYTKSSRGVRREGSPAAVELASKCRCLDGRPASPLAIFRDGRPPSRPQGQS